MKKFKSFITIILLVIIVVLLAIGFKWLVDKNNDFVYDDEFYKIPACEKNDTYKVAISISPGKVSIRDSIPTGSYKEVNTIKLINTSTCTQIVKVNPEKSFYIAERQVKIEPETTIDLPLYVDIPPNEEAGKYQSFIYFETITPNEDQKVILKSQYDYNVVKGNFGDTINYHVSKMTVYVYICIALIIFIIAFLIYFIIRSKRNKQNESSVIQNISSEPLVHTDENMNDISK